jgi:exopolysaccharide production protein ExoZ
VISNLQLLRALAALAVVFYHTDYRFGAGVHTEFQGVAVFFVISGFIMTYITRKDASGFLTHRLIRIVPLYWMNTLAMVAAAALASTAIWADTTWSHLAYSLLFIPYRNGAGNIEPLLTVGWTLNLEMLFYLLFGAMLAVSRRWAPLLTCAALLALKMLRSLGCTAAVCQLYADPYTIYLILGVVVFYLWDAMRARSGATAPWLLIPFGALVAALFLLLNAYPPVGLAAQSLFGEVPVYMMPMLIVLVALLFHSADLRCEWRLALAMGGASYALYLIHPIAIGFFKTVGRTFPILNPNNNAGIVIVILLVCSLIALAMYYWVERPLLGFLRGRLARPRDSAAVAVAPAAASSTPASPSQPLVS